MTERHSDDLTLLLHAALDGELDAAGAMDVEGRLAADPALAAEYARLVALRDAIRTRLPRERAPDALRARVIAMAQAPSQIKLTAPRRSWLQVERYRPLAASLMSRGRAGRRRLWAVRTLVGRRRRSACTGRWFHQGAAFRPDRRHRDIGSPYRQTLVRRQDRGSDDRRRSQDGRLPPGGRARRRSRQDAGCDAHLPAPRAPDRPDRNARLERRRLERTPPRNARRLFDLGMDRRRARLCRRLRSAPRRARRFRRRVPPGSRRRARRYAKALRAGSILPVGHKLRMAVISFALVGSG